MADVDASAPPAKRARTESNGDGGKKQHVATAAASKPWDVQASSYARRTVNPIRAIVDNMKAPANPPKPIIPLTIGDPTAFGNFKTPDIFVNGVVAAVRSFDYNGYTNSQGVAAARRAVAEGFTTPEAPVREEDVIIASGCSGALEIAIKAFVSEGDNILLPRPGFSLYQTLTESNNGVCKFYDLVPERNWEADLASLEAAIDDRTRVILVNNPSNPCGSVYSKEHVLDILAIAERHRLPIIADEIYRNLVWVGDDGKPLPEPAADAAAANGGGMNGTAGAGAGAGAGAAAPASGFHAVASLTTTVPVLSTGGIAKEFLVPGWRVGWILVHDRNGVFAAPGRGGGPSLRAALQRLTQLIVGANTLVQAALPDILAPTQAAHVEALARFRAATVQKLRRHAMFVYERLRKVPVLTPVLPQGAMYVMVRVDVDALDGAVNNDQEFCIRLLDEECVAVLPGQCFGIKNFFRVVFCPPMDKLEEACNRIAAFCAAHAKQ